MTESAMGYMHDESDFTHDDDIPLYSVSVRKLANFLSSFDGGEAQSLRDELNISFGGAQFLKMLMG